MANPATHCAMPGIHPATPCALPGKQIQGKAIDVFIFVFILILT